MPDEAPEQTEPSLPPAAVDAPSAPPAMPEPGAASTDPSALAAAIHEPRPYDFRGPSLLTTAELRKTRLRHDDFARSLATRLSMYLRLEFSVVVSALQTMTYRR